MKRTILLITGLFALNLAIAQKFRKVPDSGFITCSDFHVTKPLSELFANTANTKISPEKEGDSDERDKRKAQKFVFSPEKNGPAYGNDPNSVQSTMGTIPGKAPIKNFPGQTASGFYPLDPSGAAGPTHYVQMINSTTFRVLNKSTGANMLTGTLGTLWASPTPNDGDPIVLYDKAADRWFLAQFGQTGNKIYIAISTTNDPTGSYYTYTFTSPQFPDYLKFSVWQDGYYMTSNQTQKVFTFERTKMLAGNPASRAVYQTFSPPDAGYFFVPLPGDAGDGTLPAAGTPCPIFSYSDNGWGAGYSDAINIFKVTVNWVPATPTSTIASAGTVPTAAFDATYSPSWDDCPQPGTTQKLDGIGGVLMYRAQWKTWAGYNSVVLNWGVKISATQRSIKWCELRQNSSTGVWSMYQEGIYTPDASTRWMGSIAMDNNGSIGLSYLKSNSTSIYPSLCYAGRRTCDPLGTLPVAEVVAKAGAGSQVGINRDGDYAETWLDPDGITFWHTGEYLDAGGNIQTQIYSYQIAPCAAVVPVANFSGTPTTICAGSSVTFTDLSTNTPTSWAWTFTGGTPATSTLQNPVVVYNTPGTYSVTLTATNSAGSSAPVTMTNYIHVNAIPATPTASNTGPYCAGSTITLSTPTVAGATYAWTGPSAYTSALQNPTRPAATAAMGGTYSVTITVGGCTSVAGTTSVVVNPIPATPVATNSGPFCAGTTINLASSTIAGATYAWTGPSAFSSALQNPTRPGATAAMAGTYSVTATVAGCTSLAGTTTVVVNPIPATPTASNTGPYCAGSTITLNTPTVAGATYAWTGPSAYSSALQNPTRPAATAAMAGTYSVTITVGGCTSLAGTTTVVVNPIPATPTASNTGPYCPGTTISLSTPTAAGATYAWTGPSAYSSALQNPTRPGATAAMGGTYSVTITVGGCTSLAGTTSVVINTAPAVNAEANVTVCDGAAVGANTFSSTPAGATYTWTNSAPSIGLAASGTTSLPAFTATNLTASPVVATITVTPTLAGCTGAPLTFTITVNPTPVATFTSSANQCLVGNSFNFTNTGSSGAGFTYSWTFTGGTPASSTTNSPTGITFAAAGPHNITHTITSTAGCVATTNATVTVFANPTALAVTTAPSACASPTGTITIGTVTGGTGPFTYSVNGSAFTGTTSYTALAAGTYPVVVKDANGCTFTTSAIVGNSSGPTALAVTNTNETCGSANGTITIGTVTGGTGPYTYSVNGSAFTTTTSYTGEAAGTYSVVVKDAGGCIFTTSTTVTNAAGPTALAVTATNSTCGGADGTAAIGTVTGGTSAYTYSFNGSAFTSATNYTGLTAGTYSVVVKDANGCTFTTSVTVGNTGSTPATPTISQSGLVLTSSSATGNQWYLNGVLIAGATGQTYTATTNGTYTVVVTAGGCSSVTSAPVVITNVGIDESVNPYMFSIYPNPNDGNFNVTFNSAVRSNYKLELYNALGQIIFKDDITDFTGVYTKKLSVTEYGKGVYTISLTNSKNETVKKIIVY